MKIRQWAVTLAGAAVVLTASGCSNNADGDISQMGLGGGSQANVPDLPGTGDMPGSGVPGMPEAPGTPGQGGGEQLPTDPQQYAEAAVREAQAGVPKGSYFAPGVYSQFRRFNNQAGVLKFEAVEASNGSQTVFRFSDGKATLVRLHVDNEMASRGEPMAIVEVTGSSA